MKYPHFYGPLQYLHPENDMHLRTDYLIAELDRNTLEITLIKKVNTSKLDNPRNCTFIGLEDGRLFRWNGKLYLCGVRRDIDDKGTGRMELSEIEEQETEFLEVSRHSIPTVNRIESYCEKNWVPILESPFQFVKWTNPVEIVKYDMEKDETTTTLLGSGPKLQADMRGGSQIIPYKEYSLGIFHETFLHNSKAGNKNATYRHRIVLFDKDWNIVKRSELFSFMDAEVEFCCGLVHIDNYFLLSFGFQDNASFILKMSETELLERLGL
jgi:predicted GH43/DUF377 family glycosyl hydrolase